MEVSHYKLTVILYDKLVSEAHSVVPDCSRPCLGAESESDLTQHKIAVPQLTPASLSAIGHRLSPPSTKHFVPT